MREQEREKQNGGKKEGIRLVWQWAGGRRTRDIARGWRVIDHEHSANTTWRRARWFSFDIKSGEISFPMIKRRSAVFKNVTVAKLWKMEHDDVTGRDLSRRLVRHLGKTCQKLSKWLPSAIIHLPIASLIIVKRERERERERERGRERETRWSSTRRELVSEWNSIPVGSIGNSRRRAGHRELSRKSSSIAESHAPEIFADEFVMLSRKIQKPLAGNPSPFAPGYPGRPCIDFCPMEYRDTRPLTTSRSLPRSPLSLWLVLFMPLSPPATPALHIGPSFSIPLSLPLTSACPCIAIFNTLSACEAKVDVQAR